MDTNTDAAVVAFDGRTGASGDMLLGALLAAGADRDALDPVEDALPIRYDVGTVDRNGIAATAVDVVRVDGAADARDADARANPDADEAHSHDHAADRDEAHSHDHAADRDEAHSHDHAADRDEAHSHDHAADRDEAHSHDHAADRDEAHPHDHDHAHTHDDDNHGHDDHDDHGHGHHDHDRGHGHDHAEGTGPSRTYAEVRDLVAAMDVPERVRADALATFERLGEAEAAVHGTDLATTAFHEVGADDALADVVGVCALLADLDPDRVVTTPVAVGGGTAATSHGAYPVPVPAVVELLEGADWTTVGGPVDAELLTPTGAALLAHLAEGVEALPPMRVRASGYGAGDASFPDRPNVLRALVGDGTGGLRRESISVLETNLDDAPPEVLGDLHDSLAAVGALDVSIVPATMKKGRPGHLVTVVVRPADAERVARRLAVETGTLGVRERGASHRFVAERAFETVAVDASDADAADGPHEVTVKVASDADGVVFDVSAEYDDAAAVARATGLPLREVMRRAEAAVHADREGGAADDRR